MWVRARHTHQGLGNRALAPELRRKGVADEVVAEAAVAQWTTRPRRAGPSNSCASACGPPPGSTRLARIRKLVGMLARKGYPGGLAYRVVKDEVRMRADGAWTADLPG